MQGRYRLLLATLVGILMANLSVAQELSAEFGLNGKWKLGHITPVKIALSDSLRSDVTGVEIETVDGDGVPVKYQQTVEPGAGVVWAYCRIGRSGASVSVRAYAGDSFDDVRGELEISGDDATGLPSEQRLVVAIGSAMGLEALSREEQDGSQTLAIAELRAASDFPADWRALAACDLLVISTDDTQLTSEIADEQWLAADTWIKRGGGCVLSLGGEGTELPQSLAEFIPGTAQKQVRVNNPGAIESLVPTDYPLRGFEATRLEMNGGRTRLSLRDSLGRELPWWVSFSRGQGTVELVASSLNATALSAWEDRPLLWEELVSSYLVVGSSGAAEANQVGNSSYLGYDDLVGQLRATLDVFPGLKVFSFGQIAAVLIGILVLVGPVDYFVSVRLLGRPHMSWYFAGIVLVAASAGLTWFYSSIRPREIRVNTAQIVDIDTTSGFASGTLWSHVYSGAALTATIEAVDTRAESAPIQIDWQGLPGRGLGGLMSQQAADRGMPQYSILSGDGSSTIKGVGIPAAGTKCISGVWNTTTRISGESSLAELEVVDQLSGELVNPLDVDLFEPALFYHNWFYSLDSQIPAGGRFTIAYDTIPQDINRRLNRRRIVDDADMITPWDPADRNSLDRLLEIMMFYKAAKGSSYTSLAHRFHPQLDHSNLVDFDYAVLIGRVENAWAKVKVETSSGNEVASQDVDRTWCRLLIPVKPARK
ncbi:MAG: hypothetical protein Aurels2KO_16660 [Aureliella sp.]